MNKKVLVLNLDRVKSKNIFQFDAMKKHGYDYHVFSYLSPLAKYNNLSIYHSNIIFRIFQLFIYFLMNFRKVSHVELYMGGGSFLFFDYFIAKMFLVPIIVVERGSPLKDIDSYSRLPKFLRKTVYRTASIVWIRELWMEDSLKKIGVSKYFFLANSIEVKNKYSFSFDKKTTFFWANSLKPWRNVFWFISALQSDEFLSVKSIIMGLLNSKNKEVAIQEKIVKQSRITSLKILEFGDVDNYALEAKFFILPAEIVFLNFSLIECMSKGVVPIVSDVPGAREIVEDGVSGIIADHSPEGLKSAMARAMRMNKEEYEKMSFQAREKVKNNYSIESWGKKLNILYQEIS